MFTCVFCEENTVWTTSLCGACRSLKHTKLLYKDRFNEVIENCLLRTEKKIEHKEKDEINKNIEQQKQIITRASSKKA